MPLDHITRVSVALLLVVVAVGVSIPVALDQQEFSQSASGMVRGARTSEDPWSSDEWSPEALLSEAVVLLLNFIWCGLLVAGVEALDLWRERRQKKPHDYATGLPPRPNATGW